jgi:hypothetical protein
VRRKRLAQAIVTAMVITTSVTWAIGPARRHDLLPARPGESPPAAGANENANDGATLPPANVASPADKQRGVALGMFSEDVSFSYVPLLREISALGATHVALVIPIYQTDERSADLALHTRYSPTLALIADTIRAARRESLEVTVFPIIRLLDGRPGEWRGTLAPRHPRDWFERYGDVLGDLAAVAAQTGATRLVVGSELSTLDARLDDWRPLLVRIRAIFPGRLVYSANWDHFREAKIYELVDEDGVVAYFSLRASPKIPLADAALEASWRQLQRELEEWHRAKPHPLVFTELGYRSRVGSTIAPWDETAGGIPDLDEQRRAFAAFHHVWTRQPQLDGAYIWNWYGWGGPQSHGYTPRGKPAAEEVRHLLQDL